ISPHPNTFFNPSLLNWNWDDVIVIPSDDDEANVNKPIPLPVEDADVEVILSSTQLYLTDPKLLHIIILSSTQSYLTGIVVPSDDDKAHAEEDISTSINTQVHVKTRKRVYALIDESDSDDEPYWSNAFLF
nr:hypothetical protein [Tanacetum cinerariifolium]